jgi:hypothetical protein
MNKYSNIPVKRATKERLAKYGNKGETWDELLNRLLAAASPALMGEDSHLKEVKEA